MARATLPPVAQPPDAATAKRGREEDWGGAHGGSDI